MRWLTPWVALGPGLLLAQVSPPAKPADLPSEEEWELLQVMDLLEGLEDDDLELLLPTPAPARDGGSGDGGRG